MKIRIYQRKNGLKLEQLKKEVVTDWRSQKEIIKESKAKNDVVIKVIKGIKKEKIKILRDSKESVSIEGRKSLCFTKW